MANKSVIRTTVNGSTVTWGAADDGGDSSQVAEALVVGVQQIYSTHHAFAAVKTDGSTVTWGAARYGGDSSRVAEALNWNA